MFQHDNSRHAGLFSRLHIGASLKKAAKWYLENAAESYVWSSKPFNYRKD